MEQLDEAILIGWLYIRGYICIYISVSMIVVLDIRAIVQWVGKCIAQNVRTLKEKKNNEKVSNIS